MIAADSKWCSCWKGHSSVCAAKSGQKTMLWCWIALLDGLVHWFRSTVTFWAPISVMWCRVIIPLHPSPSLCRYSHRPVHRTFLNPPGLPIFPSIPTPTSQMKFLSPLSTLHHHFSPVPETNLYRSIGSVPSSFPSLHPRSPSFPHFPSLTLLFLIPPAFRHTPKTLHLYHFTAHPIWFISLWVTASYNSTFSIKFPYSPSTSEGRSNRIHRLPIYWDGSKES